MNAAVAAVLLVLDVNVAFKEDLLRLFTVEKMFLLYSQLSLVQS